MSAPHIFSVEQDDTNLLMRFRLDQVPDLAYVNQFLLDCLHNKYDNNFTLMVSEIAERGTILVSFCPKDNGSVSIDTWDALCTILDEYMYTLKDARCIIRWMDENIKMEDQEHVYIQILEGASE